MRVTHSFTDENATIRIEGLAAPVRMLQLTDTHMHFYDERDGAKVAVCADFIKRREKHMKEEEGIDYVPGESFSKNLAQAANSGHCLAPHRGAVDAQSRAERACSQAEQTK